MHTIVFQAIVFTFVCGLVTASEYGTGFRTRSSRRSNLRTEDLSSYPLRKSSNLPAAFGIDEFEKAKTAGEEQVTKGVSAAQKNMLTFYETYMNGINDMSSKMKGLMENFGVPKEFYEKVGKPDGGDVSEFVENEDSPKDLGGGAPKGLPFSG